MFSKRFISDLTNLVSLNIHLILRSSCTDTNLYANNYWICSVIIIIIIIALQPSVGTWPFFQFLDPTHSQQDSVNGDVPVIRPLPTQKNTDAE
jgi:hypothetical protein